MAITETSKRAKEIADNSKSNLKKTKGSKKLKKDSKKKVKAKVTNNKASNNRISRLMRYFPKSFRELKKVTWPSRKESWRLTFAVVAFSGVFTGLTVIVDYIFKNIIQRYVI